jgi:hypothetical protein
MSEGKRKGLMDFLAIVSKRRYMAGKRVGIGEMATGRLELAKLLGYLESNHPSQHGLLMNSLEVLDKGGLDPNKAAGTMKVAIRTDLHMFFFPPAADIRSTRTLLLYPLKYAVKCSVDSQLKGIPALRTSAVKML